MLKIEEPNSIRILDNRSSSIKRFDHVFWSCDGYKKREDGYLEPDGPQSNYADQVNFKNFINFVQCFHQYSLNGTFREVYY